MKAVIELEAIGDNLRRIRQGLLSGGNSAEKYADAMPRRGRLRTYALFPPPRPWVARISGTDSRYGLAREFVEPHRDYAHVNSTGSRGIMLYFVVDEGSVYEVHKLVSWKNHIRYFCRIENGEEIRMTRDEVDQWLKEKILSE